jgi:hypothetical protein
METQTRKISVSAGLLAIVVLHAFIMRAPLPTMQSQSIAPRSFSFDTIQQSIANPNASQVNVTARDEAKRQVPSNCIPCAQLQLPVQTRSQLQTDQVKTQAAKPPGKYYNIDVFVGSDQQSQALLNAFNSEPLKSLAAKCNYQVYAPGDQLYKQRYSQWIPASQFPAIVMTRQDGGHVYIASQAEIPNTASGIQAAMRSATEASVKAEQLAKQANPVESSPDCVDGTCKKPPYFDRQPRDEPSLFPLRQPDPTELITSFFRSQGIGLESVGLLVIATVVIILIFKQR